MNLRRVVYPFTVAVVFVVFQPHGKADTAVEKSRDLQESTQAARQSVAPIFSGLLNSILAAQAGNPVTSKPQFKLVFSVGAGGKVVDVTTGFECESECEVTLEDVLRATYEVIPDEDYQFAGWSGDICNGPETHLNSACDVTVGWSKIGAADELQVRARFARKANIELAGNTAEFEISNYGFGSLFTDETKPVTCYPTPDNCSVEGEIAYIVPGDSAQGDFNRDGYQDLLIMEFMSYGYVRDQKANPTIYLNDQQGGLYRSDSIFAEGFPVGMDFGYRIAVEDFNSDGFDDFFIAAMGTLSQEPRNLKESVFERYILYLSGPDGKLYDRSDQIEGQENGAVLPDMGSHHLAAGDIDGDGDVDIFIWPGLILNDGQGNFSTSASWHEVCQCRDGTMSAIIDDFDGDGMGDLVMFPSDPVSTGRLFLSRGEGDLASRQMTMLPEGYFGHANTKQNHADTADIDYDGDIDIIVGQTRASPYYKGKYLQILINDGYGNFTDETAARLGDQSLYVDGERPPEGEGVVYLQDVNADGYVDIFDRRNALPPEEGYPLHTAVAIWLNDGTGNFVEVPPTVFPFVEPRDLAPWYGENWQTKGQLWGGPIHLNKDGFIDIVSYVPTGFDSVTAGGFKEGTLYTLTAKKKLEAGNYADQE